MIARLLDGGPQVLATGGGAFMNADTRAADRRQGHLDLAQGRVRRADAPRSSAATTGRCCKTDDPAATLRELIDVRYPVYALADLTVQSREVPHERIVDEIVDRARCTIWALPTTAPASAQQESTRHDRAAARRRADHRRGRARRRAATTS